MYLKYKHMQIVKHALQYYVQREDADEHDLMVLLLAIVVSGWRVIFKNEQKNQEEES